MDLFVALPEDEYIIYQLGESKIYFERITSEGCNADEVNVFIDDEKNNVFGLDAEQIILAKSTEIHIYNNHCKIDSCDIDLLKLASFITAAMLKNMKIFSGSHMMFYHAKKQQKLELTARTTNYNTFWLMIIVILCAMYYKY
jgi:hypothetical protein